MKKRLIALLLTLVCVLGLFAAVPAYADEPETTAPVEETAAPAEETAALAEAVLAVEDRPSARQLHKNRHDDEERREEDERNDRERLVQQPLLAAERAHLPLVGHLQRADAVERDSLRAERWKGVPRRQEDDVVEALDELRHLAAKEPRVLAGDEDAHAARMRDRGKTIVLITHDPEVAAWADRIVHIRDGKLLTDEQERAFTARHERKGASS